MKTRLFLYIVSCVCALLQNGFVRNRRIPSNARPADTQRKFNSVLAHNQNPTSNLLKETHVQRMSLAFMHTILSFLSVCS
jgi:hypothetical protein